MSSRREFITLLGSGAAWPLPAYIVVLCDRRQMKSQAKVTVQAVERQATTQLTTLTSLLAGFGFLWFTSLVDKELLTPFSLVILVVTALTIFVLVLGSIVGALLTIASEIAIREGLLHRAEAIWVVATKGGMLLFLTTVALLLYRLSFVGGVICSIFGGRNSDND